MSVKKEFVVPGTKIVVTHNLCLIPDGCWLTGHGFPPAGSVLTILSKPKKIQSVNLVKLLYQEKEYFAFYYDVRYKADMI